MPNVWAHIQYGRELLAATAMTGHSDDPDWKKAFQFGCQGPDFLFYHRFLPWQPSTLPNKLGTLLHNEECGPFLITLLEAARDRDRSLRDPGTAFALGFLLHHLLDRHLHPFVFSRSGFRKWEHQRFETALDAALMPLRAGIDTSRTPVAPEIDTEGKLPGAFAQPFLQAAKRHYPALADRITTRQLDEAAADMVKAMKLFYDPTGWKKKLTFGQLAPFSPPLRPPAWDVLNEARAPWIDPTDRTAMHTDSALQLWDRALEDGEATFRAALAWLEATDEADESETEARRRRCAERLGNISYETGLPCGVAWITFADPHMPPA